MQCIRHLFIGAERGDSYKSIVEAIQPDILIENDCKSIGGAWQMCITNIAPFVKETIISIPVPEFKGIDHPPRSIAQLKESKG